MLAARMQKIFVFSFVGMLSLGVLSQAVYGKINLSKSSDDSLFPAIAVNSTGDIMVVWTEWSSGQIYYAINRNGTWSGMRNSGLNVQLAWSNEIVVDSYGTFHITCADGRGSHNRDIAYSYFAGNSWAPAEKIYISPYNSAWNKMAIDKNDDIYVIWYHSHIPKGETFSSDAVAMSKPRMGNWPAKYENISRNRSTESIHPAIAVLNGRAYAIWMEDERPRRLYFSEKTGGSWKTPVEILRGGYYPDIVVDNSGNLHVVYSNWGGNFYYLSRMGGRWSDREIISNGESPLQFGEIQHKNNVIVAGWIQGRDGNWSVYATAKIVGDKWAVPVKIADAPGGSEGNKHVHIALDNKNCAHFVWEGIGVGGKNDIFYEKYCVETPKDATFIEVDNSFLSFQSPDGSNPAPQTFRVRASGYGSINYTITDDKGWLSVSPTQGSSSGEWDTITVSVNVGNLNDGTYDGKITINDPNAYNNPVEVGVSLTKGDVTPPPPSPPPPGTSFIEVDKLNLTFTTEEGANPPSQSFNLRSTDAEGVKFSISTNKDWLEVYPTEGTATTSWAPVSVIVDASGLAPGTHKGRITITAQGASVTQTNVFVELTIKENRKPTIQLNRASFYFFAYANGDDPPPNTFKIRNSGSQTLSYSITSNKSWIKVSPKKGTSTGEWDTITVSVDISSLGLAKHTGNIQITASGAENSPQNISVECVVELPPRPYAPLNVTIKRLNHEGLLFQEYKSKIDWEPNPKNAGLFNIVKYRIFRKDKSKPGSSYVYVGEVAGNVTTYFDGGFSTKEERNNYVYSVAAVDDAGRESFKADSLSALEGVSGMSFSGQSRVQKKPRKGKK